MNDTGQTSSQSSGTSQGGTGARSGCFFCGTLRNAFEEAANAVRPPEEVEKHFREARKEFWIGIRELIDAKIARMSRHEKGRSVVVE